MLQSPIHKPPPLSPPRAPTTAAAAVSCSSRRRRRPKPKPIAFRRPSLRRLVPAPLRRLLPRPHPLAPFLLLLGGGAGGKGRRNGTSWLGGGGGGGGGNGWFGRRRTTRWAEEVAALVFSLAFGDGLAGLAASWNSSGLSRMVELWAALCKNKGRRRGGFRRLAAFLLGFAFFSFVCHLRSRGLLGGLEKMGHGRKWVRALLR